MQSVVCLMRPRIVANETKSLAHALVKSDGDGIVVPVKPRSVAKNECGARRQRLIGVAGDTRLKGQIGVPYPQNVLNVLVMVGELDGRVGPQLVLHANVECIRVRSFESRVYR